MRANGMTTPSQLIFITGAGHHSKGLVNLWVVKWERTKIQLCLYFELKQAKLFPAVESELQKRGVSYEVTSDRGSIIVPLGAGCWEASV